MELWRRTVWSENEEGLPRKKRRACCLTKKGGAVADLALASGVPWGPLFEL